MKRNVFGIPVYQYQVRLPGFSFEGPLDLLLQLIERNELPIAEISLANIADEYTDYINQLTEINPAELSEFLVISAKLLLIKSAALLPAPPARPGAAEQGPSEAEELLSQLREYKRIREASQFLQERQEQALHSYPSQRIGPSETQLREVNAVLEKLGRAQAGEGLQGLKLNDLLSLVKRRLNSQQQQQLKLPLALNPEGLATLGRSVKIEDRIIVLEERLKTEKQVAFTSLFEPSEQDEKQQNIEIIVTFMAVLELLRRKTATAHQDALFGEIFVEKA